MKTKELQPQDDPAPEGRTQEEIKVKKYAFVSRRAIDMDHIGYCYRDYPENNIDSGWRFLYGDEDDQYLTNPTNIESVYPEDMISINPAIDLILGAQINMEFEWDEELERFVEIS